MGSNSYNVGGHHPTGSSSVVPNDVDNHSNLSESVPSDQRSSLDKLGKVNWLGSSYSGADIKAVAHLYDTVSTDAMVSRLEDEKLYSQSILDAVANIGSSTIDAIRDISSPSLQREAALAATGIPYPSTEGQQRAARQVRDAVLSIRNGNEWLNLKANLQSQHSSIVRSIEDKISAYQELSGTATKVLGELQTISIETFRSKKLVRSCGTSYPRGAGRGPRTIAGSMVFTVFDRHPLLELMRAMQLSNTYGEVDKLSDISTYLPDQIPPIDITIAFANENGSISEQRIYGVEFVNDSVTYSIEDIFTENINNFIARDVDIILPKGRIRLSQMQRGMHLNDEGIEMSASDLLFGNQDYENYLDRIGMRRRKISL